MGKIHDISTPPDLLFLLVLKQNKEQSLWKRFENIRDGLTQFKNSISSLLQCCKPHQINSNFRGILYTIS